MTTKLNALQQVFERLQISKAIVRDIQSKLEINKTDNGEVLLNFEHMISLLEDIYIASDLNDNEPIENNWHNKFN
jgi:hypothetical protein